MIYPSIFSSFPHVIAGFSAIDDFPPSLLSRGSWSQADVVLARNYISDKLFGSSLCAYMNQAHTDVVERVVDFGFPAISCDAIFTDLFSLPLSVHVADCVSVLLYFDSPTKPMVAVAHVGWRGARGSLLSSLLTSLFSTSSDGRFLYVFVGPHICSSCYAFGPEAYDLFDHAYVSSIAGVMYVDIASMVVDAFLRFGVPKDHIEVSPLCTYERPDLFFSYRKNGSTNKRMFGMIGLCS